jgi:protein-disulfide isomerase
MTPEESRTPRSGSQGSKLADAAMLATLVGVIVILAVSMINRREVRRLRARVTQLETIANAPTPQGALLNKVYAVDIAQASAKGPANAPVTLVVFSEFQCPFCLSVTPTLKQLEETYTDRVRFVWKHLPLTSIHPHAMGAAIAAEAASNQGKFWEYHDKLFANQQRIAPEDLKRYAQELGLDVGRFERDLEDPNLKEKVLLDMAQATSLSVKSTPTVFINGRLVKGAMPFETYATIIDDELAKRSERRASNASAEGK